MKIHTINLDDEGMPTDIVATITVAEAAFLARILGKLNHPQGERYGVSDAYDELVGNFFNRFYDGGVDDVETPKPEVVVK